MMSGDPATGRLSPVRLALLHGFNPSRADGARPIKPPARLSSGAEG
jgi:hypothetical protein